MSPAIPIACESRLPEAPLTRARQVAVVFLACLLALLALAVRGSGREPLWLAQLQPTLAQFSPTLWSLLSVAGLGWAALGFVSVQKPALAERLWPASLFALLLGGLLAQVLKKWINAPRPPSVLDAGELWVTGDPLYFNAMPSGHSATAATLVLLIWALARPPRWGQVLLIWAAVSVGLARVGVGAHWASDVLAGWALGLVVGLLALHAVPRAPRWMQGVRGVRGRAAVGLLSGCVLALTPWGYPLAEAGQWLMGLCLIAAAGWQLWRYGQLARPAALLRVLLGLVLLLLLLAWAAPQIDLQQWRATLARVSAAEWLLAALALLLSLGLRGWRVQLEWRARREQSGVPTASLSYGASLRLLLLHTLALNWAPLRSGELGYLWLAQRQYGATTGEALASLVWLRLQDLLVLASLSLAALLAWWLGQGAALALLISALIFLAGSVLLRAMLGRLALRPGAAPSGRWQRLRGALAQAPSQGAQRPIALLSLANWWLKLAALGGLLMALLDSSALQGLLAAIGGELGGMWPIQATAGLGSYEAGVAGVAAWLGTELALPLILAAALAVHGLALLLSTAAGLLVLLFYGLPAPASAATLRVA
ncbi:phosphatase PAP2 family protein [Paucibacter sp. DJ2R-2]|uniref:phosphatase PAP2 family protein n=1 Tax=Paucibacter sp. DJ2R-2 TaxID=2893558 RepID=UPI0021E3FE0B|nr:phosphatase PAP2 family protein [Paucibacter sp. DJ2R-2]MCV2421690.1 phosphatase PAP2 family protein [Paucibacter sp. DJ4R-1]MCV2438395.1 phosphatase PAP2 family protein [Paucibacter sp. DJ2R-2]